MILLPKVATPILGCQRNHLCSGWTDDFSGHCSYDSFTQPQVLSHWLATALYRHLPTTVPRALARAMMKAQLMLIQSIVGKEYKKTMNQGIEARYIVGASIPRILGT